MTARIALLMGSDSDFPRLESTVQTLREFGEEPEVRVLSAHRTPEEACEFASSARKRGLQVLLCAAGGAAHLAGVIAAHTSLPVIGIPMDNPPLGGLDALLATVQMPGGIPVGTVGVGGGGPKNAALLALRILGSSDKEMAQKLDDFRETQRTRVLEKDSQLQGRLQSS
ncbi:MAG TPA: 5-(carboxyamino)imidazole ribonucleotide mutase [Planctomycetota bacterium]|jgi:phosphoribosylaminoimidazole carboxylase PurE protein|nr:5-(carboxyamino)imidazole ribonucleotide mutase [Planctomycetota bacterium]MDP6128849.1 5-(carboxyamino)imidazole ribonucleotide mutase [Planctomycetota bacterium]MDP7246358.1 5-(carboxyamino)imidazole ribonucleotide mutase [Planctomycetota bacterium]MDP7559673.1 5-(carboxyamino)imidazole ribonucleotide mutase [Planctomycetota bacterium]HJM38486.1 5-(carboxyamino)imidazole ribonucleotide mutase [Planctomycetota bacterium]|tara:strand:+ start:5831 stop:6337 length:507 start_codon:yes stop_codon:yes gene_type:complete